MTQDPFEFAMQSLDVLREADLVVAPQTPTNTMIEAAKNVMDLDEETIRRLYDVMMDAAHADPRETQPDNQLAPDGNQEMR